MADKSDLTNVPAPTEAEQDVIRSARNSTERCRCGEIHEDECGITPAVIARMMGDLGAHPGHQFAVDEEAGIVAVIAVHDPADPDQTEILARSEDLIELLDTIGAPAAADLS